MSDLMDARPPTSSHVTLGIEGAPILVENADRAPLNAISKSVDVRSQPAINKSSSGSPRERLIYESAAILRNLCYRPCISDTISCSRLHPNDKIDEVSSYETSRLSRY